VLEIDVGDGLRFPFVLFAVLFFKLGRNEFDGVLKVVFLDGFVRVAVDAFGGAL
jgi:hypothetical protein